MQLTTVYEQEPLVKAIWGGVKAMLTNTGACTNEEMFWKAFTAVCGAESRLEECCTKLKLRFQLVFTKDRRVSRPFSRNIYTFGTQTQIFKKDDYNYALGGAYI